LSRGDNAVLNEIKVYAESTFPFCVNAFLTPFEKDICIRIEYDALQYRPDDMHVAGQFYVDVLNAMVEAPYSNYNERHFLSDAMYEQIVDKMSGSEEVDESVANILETISEYEESMSDRLAVADPSSSMTYGELAKYSNGLATNLVNEVGAKCKFIVICMNRSSDLIPTILGVLKAGKAYVPISPDFPNKRIESIVNELDAVILCDEENSKRFLDSAFKTINVTANRASYLNSKGCGPKVDISLSDAAYVIYTSGSTGKPKGVLVNHDCLASTTKARLQYYSLNPNEKHVLVSSSSFDSSIAVIFGALASGAALLVSDDRTIKDSSLLVNFMREQQATSLLSVPSLLATLLDENLDGVKSLKRIISAGETLPKDLAGKLKLSLSADLYNEYGPTEATVWATVFKVDKIPEQANVPIGRPIKGVQVHILDNNMHQVPVAVQGELYIGGAGVADGYVNDTELTSDRFVENPFSDVPGSRLYRTGDIARFNHDGDVEFIGRSDRLVKIQGFRVELTEVEAVLNEHESVEKSIVVVSDDKVGQKYLCAYVLPSNEHKKDIDVQELKDSTKKVLPKYMIPSVIIVMSQLPLTSSGKLDYDHLPSPGRYLIERSSTYIAPTTETEKVIASVWCSVLSAERVGVNDDFIELGGESLAAMKIMAQIRKIYSVSISLGEVFDDVTTVAKVSLKIDSLLHEKVESRADREAETGEL
jgi:amino acid adenylation domain-containing protein